MNYNKDKWLKRIRSRSDISAYLTHFTRDNESKNAIDVLIQILKQKTIVGSSNEGFIIGTNTAVCFQDAPLHGLTQNLIHEQYNHKELGNKTRYKGIGLAFSKIYAFRKGVKPVIYEKKEIATKILPPDEWWRVVSFDLADDNNIIDWTHEREWRVKGNFEFELSETYVYLVKQSSYKTFIEKADPDITKNIKGIVVLDPVLT